MVTNIRFSKLAVMSVLIVAASLFLVNTSYAGKQKFSELESYTIKYKVVEGSKQADITAYSQDWGRCVVQISGNEKSIVLNNDNEQVAIFIDQANNQGIKTVNPNLKDVVAKMKGKSPKEFSDELMINLGGKVVGNKMVAGEKCTNWELQGTSTCLTDDGITIETIVPGKFAQTLLELKRNEPGPKDACDYSKVSIQEVDPKTLMQQPQ